MRRGLGVKGEAEGRAVTEPPVVSVTQLDPRRYLGAAVLFHFHTFLRVAQKRRVVIDVRDGHLP